MTLFARLPVQNAPHIMRCGILAVTLLLAATMAASPQQAQANSRYGSIVVDAYTGEVLSADGADKQLYPASLTKMMTLFLTFEALEQKKISLNTKLPVSKRATGMSPSKLNLREGETIRVEDAIYALVTKSANDVAVVLAEGLAGSEIQFARKMTERAHELGMKQTEYRNASGLPNRYQKTTPRDQATLARVMVSRYPEYYTYFSTRNFNYHGHSYRNHNKLLGSYEGLDGIKTGYINASGFNLVASAQREGRRIIGVVFGGRTSASRNSHMVKLLDKGFEAARTRNLMMAGVPPVPNRRPSSQMIASNDTSSDKRLTDNRLLQVASMDKPALLQNNRLTLASVSPATALAEPQPDIAPEDMLSMAPIPNAKPSAGDEVIEVADADEDPELGDSRLVIAGLGPINQDEDSAQGDIDPSDAEEVTDTGNQPTGLTRLLGEWSIQVGAFSSEKSTAIVIKQAREAAPDLLGWAEGLVKPIVTGRGTLYRARLAGLDESTARDACRRLERMGMGCLPVRNTTRQ
jgi:D-alanyl-D-alanine carboxypeptidase